MDKADIARHFHPQAGISETESARVLEWILAFLKTTLHKGERITISDFGKFTVRDKASRTGRNFKTGEALIISARRVVSFHPSLRLKTEVNAVPAERHDAVARLRRTGLLPKGT